MSAVRSRRMKRTAVVLVLLGACSSGGGAAAPTTAPPTTVGQIPQEAVDVCRSAVKDKLVEPESAKFDPVPATNTAGTSWQIRGTITTVNGFGNAVSIDYSCLVNPSGSSWVVGDITVTPG